MRCDAVAMARRVAWKLLALPIFYKVLGVGASVALLFGAATIVQARLSVDRALRAATDRTALSIAGGLAARVERPLVTGDRFAVHETLLRAMGEQPDLIAVEVRGREGQLIAASAAAGTEMPQQGASGSTRLAVPILDGSVGTLHIALSDSSISRELDTVTTGILRALAGCAAMGVLLALALSWLLSKPIRHLVSATEGIRAGNYASRAPTLPPDEVGRLAARFNEMAVALQEGRERDREQEHLRKKLLSRLIRSQEDERKRLARDLHDDIGQALSALLMAVHQDSDGRGGPRWTESLAERITALIDRARRISWALRPSVLDDYGLDVALRRLAEETSLLAGIPFDYEVLAGTEPWKLDQDTELTLYRVAQEAIRNVVRHACASQGSVVLIHGDKEISLLVEDDGNGFDPERVVRDPERGGLGLLGMRERASLVGGTLLVESTPGEGTTLRVVVPVTGAEE